MTLKFEGASTSDAVAWPSIRFGQIWNTENVVVNGGLLVIFFQKWKVEDLQRFPGWQDCSFGVGQIPPQLRMGKLKWLILTKSQQPPHLGMELQYCQVWSSETITLSKFYFIRVFSKDTDENSTKNIKKTHYKVTPDVCRNIYRPTLFRKRFRSLNNFEIEIERKRTSSGQGNNFFFVELQVK